MVFKYKGLDKDGKKVKASLEALTLEDARKKLKTSGIIYSEIKEYKQLFRKKCSFREF